MNKYTYPTLYYIKQPLQNCSKNLNLINTLSKNLKIHLKKENLNVIDSACNIIKPENDENLSKHTKSVGNLKQNKAKCLH